jgi:hypothetical protein
LPVCLFCVGVEQAQIGDEMLLVVARQIPVSRRNIIDRRIERWRLHVSLHFRTPDVSHFGLETPLQKRH